MRPPRPIPLPVRPEGIPKYLRRLRRWVIWRYAFRGKKWTKVPYIATSPASEAKSTDASTWCSYDDAHAAYAAGRCDGIGFVLGDGYVGYDQDDTTDLTYLRILNTYAEISPSGRGAHAIALGEKPGSRCRTGAYELYARGRYFTVTGHHIEEFPATVEARTDEIAIVYHRLFPSCQPRVSSASTPATHRSGLATDDAIVVHARANDDKFRRLWEGDLSAYPSHSEAAAALCCVLAFWTGKNAQQMDRLYRRSGLMSEKWDARRRNSTWGADLIEHAIATTDSVCTARSASLVSVSRYAIRGLQGLHGTR